VGCELNIPFFFPLIIDTMNTELSIGECKIMWVVGALERLATLGLIGPDVPLKLTANAVEDYLQIDEHRELLFESDFEIASIFTALANDECDPDIQDPDDIKPIIDLLLEYKDNRTEIVKYALSQQFV
jgi:hypothetical protein